MVLSIHRKTALILTVVLAAMLAACSQQKVQNVEHESEANRIVDILGESGIRAVKREAGEGERKFFEIVVDAGD
jgi:type III secretory pathway lipoprotein EscJ